MSEHVAAAAAMASGGHPSEVVTKGFQDYVTDMDRRLEETLRSALAPLFGVPVLGEESIADDEVLPDAAVVVDPLDGTGNWIAGIPFAAVSVAYIEKGQSIMAAVAAIGHDAVFTAEAGGGAWRNGERLQLPVAVPNPLFAISTGLCDQIAASDVFGRLRGFGKLRNFGSQALQLCAVAQGSLAFNASIEARLWDDAAGRLIATEAGASYHAYVRAELASLPASRQRSLCAHPEIAAEIAALLSPYLDPDRS